MKKIMFLITGLGLGGAEQTLFKLLPKLNDNFEITLVSILGIKDIGEKIEKKGIKVIYLNESKKFHLFLSILNFRKIIKDTNPKTLVTILIHADLFGRFFGKLFGIKRIYSSIRNDNSKLTILNKIDTCSRFLVDLYLPNSDALVDILHKKNKIPLKKIKVIPNGVDLKLLKNNIDVNYDLKKELKISKDKIILTCVARFKTQKNHKVLIEAFSKIKNINSILVLFGYGPEETYLRELVNKFNLNKKIFFIDGKKTNVSSILSNSDIFILPSIIEGMSNALLEAMAFKLPCIVSDISQNTILIKNKFNGLVFDTMDNVDLANKIDILVSDKNLMRQYGQKSLDLINEKYLIDKIVIKFKKILE